MRIGQVHSMQKELLVQMHVCIKYRVCFRGCVQEGKLQTPRQLRSMDFISGAVESGLKIFNIIGGDVVYDQFVSRELLFPI